MSANRDLAVYVVVVVLQYVYGSPVILVKLTGRVIIWFIAVGVEVEDLTGGGVDIPVPIRVPEGIVYKTLDIDVGI